MLSRYFKRFLRMIRNFLLMMFNKEFLIFLFFLALSGSFWLIITLNETYDYELSVPVKITGVPRNVVITGTNVDTVSFTVRDKGYMIGAYIYGQKLTPISVDFNSHAQTDGKGQVGQTELSRMITTQLYKSTKLTSVKPSAYTFSFNLGQNKRVPIKLLGTVLTSDSYYLSNFHFSPEYVTVYGSKAMLDSIRYVYTTRLDLRDINDTTVVRVSLRPIRGAKITPSEVKLFLYPDVLTEESVEVPITAVNMPSDKVLRTFPTRVKVSFVIGVGQMRRLRNVITPSAFRVEADYNDLVNHPSDKCRLTLRNYPGYVRSPKLVTSEVDYLIEQ